MEEREGGKEQQEGYPALVAREELWETKEQSSDGNDAEDSLDKAMVREGS
jgi:hypothetical protein